MAYKNHCEDCRIFSCVGYHQYACFLDDDNPEPRSPFNAKAWLDRHNIKYHDQGFSGGGFDSHTADTPLNPHVIVTSYTNKDSLFVFDHLDEAEPCRMCVIASGMVDVITQ